MEQLPGESRFQTALRDAIPEDELAAMAEDQDGHGRWSHLEYLIAQLIDATKEVGYIVLSVNTEARIPKPEPVRRPGIPDPEKQRIAYIEDQAAKHRDRAARREAELAARGETA